MLLDAVALGALLAPGVLAVIADAGPLSALLDQFFGLLQMLPGRLLGLLDDLRELSIASQAAE